MSKPLTNDMRGVVPMAGVANRLHMTRKNGFEYVIEVSPAVIADILRNNEFRQALSKSPFAEAVFALSEDRNAAKRPIAFKVRPTSPTLNQ